MASDFLAAFSPFMGGNGSPQAGPSTAPIGLGAFMAQPDFGTSNPGPQAPSVADLIASGAANGPSSPVMAAPPTPPPQKGGFRDFLGRLGDVLLQTSGMDPIYGPRKKERELGTALSQFLGADSPLAGVAIKDPATAAGLWKVLQDNGSDLLKAQVAASAPSANMSDFAAFQGMSPAERQQFSQYEDVAHPVMATTWQGPTTVPRGSAPSAPDEPQEGATATNPQTGEKVVLRNGQWVPATGGASTTSAAVEPVRTSLINTYGPVDGEQKFQAWLAKNHITMGA